MPDEVHPDKLTHDERVRLECVAQAVAFQAATRFAGAPDVGVVQSAQLFEAYITGGGDVTVFTIREDEHDAIRQILACWDFEHEGRESPPEVAAILARLRAVVGHALR